VLAISEALGTPFAIAYDHQCNLASIMRYVKRKAYARYTLGVDVVRCYDLGVLGAGILDAAIGVMNQAAPFRLPSRNCHDKRFGYQIHAQMRLQCPADDLTAEHIKHDGEIAELLRQMR
jgi:hypothetical protein